MCSTLLPAAAAAEPLKLTAITWPPYVSTDLTNNGLAMDLVNTAFTRAGYETELVIERTDRTIEGTAAGVYDVAALLWKSKEREAELAFSEPYFINSVGALKRKSSEITLSKFEDLRGLIIGYVRGYAYGERFDNARGLIKIPANHVVQNVIKLAKGEIDIAIGDDRVLLYEAAHNMPNAAGELELIPYAFVKKGLHIAVRKDHPQRERILADFNKAIADMKADGSWDRIVETHDAEIAKASKQK